MLTAAEQAAWGGLGGSPHKRAANSPREGGGIHRCPPHHRGPHGVQPLGIPRQ